MNIKSRIRFIARAILGKKTEDVMKDIETADIVSFDIYDTLVLRDLPTPECVHFFTEKKFYERTGREIRNYKDIRMQAELSAKYRADGREITLDEIYREMRNIDAGDRKLLMSIEQEIEYAIACANSEMRFVYRKAQELGKRICIVSDMYLPEDLIQRILRKCGYEGYTLYLSSTIGVTKHSGRLFSELIKDYDQSTAQILHIGDHVKSDYLRAHQKRIKAVLIENRRNRLLLFKRKRLRTKDDESIYLFLNNHKQSGEASIAYSIGYELLGPMLWGFCSWLKDKSEEDGIEKLYFLSREGKLLLEAYNLMYPEDRRGIYLQVSRKALLTPMLAGCCDYHELIRLIKPLFTQYTLKNIGELCGSEKEYKEYLKDLECELENSIFDIPVEKQQQYMELFRKLGKTRFEEQNRLVRRYLMQNNFAGKLAIVDVGWQGTMQLALSSFAGKDTELIGYYVGVRDMVKNSFHCGIKRRGYLFEPGKNEEWGIEFRFATGVTEDIFTKPSGSVIGYTLEENQACPLLEASEPEEAEVFLKEIQDAALDFVFEWKSSTVKEYVELTDRFIMSGYKSFAVNPTLKIVQCFRCLRSLGDMHHNALPEKSSKYYFLHPIALVKAVENSISKTFALKWIFKLPFPYYKVLKFFFSNTEIKSRHMIELEREE